MKLIGKNGFMASLIVRLVPSAPFIVVNMAAGVTPMKVRDFVAGTAIGIIPKIALTAFAGGDPWGGGGPLLAFVWRGWENPDADPRASLQYVEYALVEGRLERRARPALDGARLGPPQVLLRDVDGVRPAFLFNGAWTPTWKGNPQSDIPTAVRLDMTLADLGRVDQLFLTSGEGR